MQKWRMGGKGTMPLSPKEFGEAIDDCIRLLRSISDKDYEYSECYDLPIGLFPEVTFENSPKKVELKLVKQL